MSHPPPAVHGLSGNLTAPDWPALSLTEAQHVLALRPSCGACTSIAWHSPRPLSAAALVHTPHGRFFIKRHHQRVRSAATLGEEHAFALYLRSRGIPTPKILAEHAGATVTVLGDWVYEVHELVAGEDLYRDRLSWEPMTDVSHAQAAGAMLAQLHQAAADFVAPQRSTHVLVARSDLIRTSDPVAALAAQLPQRPALADYLRDTDWRTPLRDALAPWHDHAHARLATLPRRWTHGDWHGSNLAWQQDGDATKVSAVFDFGLCAENFALFDLATAIERNAIAWLQQDDDRARPDIARALIHGYRTQCPLSTDELELVANILPIVHVDFALSEVEYYHAITGSKANADLAWFDFLQGHAAWFSSRHGRALLDAIRSAP